jgi:uncharacterized protein YxjI
MVRSTFVSTIAIMGIMACIGGGIIYGVTQCKSKDISHVEYTVDESFSQKIKTLDLGFRYEISKDGNLEYVVLPDYKEKFNNLLLANAYVVENQYGEVINVVDGKVLTISEVHNVYDAEGNLEKTISAQVGGGLMGRAGRLMMGRDGFYIKDLNGNEQLNVRETWGSVFSPWLREYTIEDPETGKKIGVIKNELEIKGFFGAQKYNIQLDQITKENEINIALVMPMLDYVEDQEDAKSASSSNNSSND